MALLWLVLCLGLLACRGGFVYTTVKKGYERLLKLEVLQAYPDLKPSFSRPGLITYKTDDTSVLDNFFHRRHPQPFIFMRSCGLSIPSQVSTASDIIAQARTLGQQPLGLHVWGREEEQGLKSEHPQVGIDRRARIEAFRQELQLLGGPDLFHAEGSSEAKDNEVVLDVCVGEDGEKAFLGQHLHTAGLVGTTAFANNLLPTLTMPPESPSRAFMKIEEAIGLLGLASVMREGHTAVEIGSAPGGCVYSLLQRGLTVCGVDPCPADRTHAPIVKKSKRFSEVRTFLRNLRVDQVPPSAEWLLCDANVPGEECIPYLVNMAAHYRPTLRALLYTCKLSDKVYDMEPQRLLAYLRETREAVLQAGGGGLFDDVTMLTLPSHRQEILIFAKTRLCC